MLAPMWSDPNIKYIGCTYCKYSLSSSPASMQHVHTFHTHFCKHFAHVLQTFHTQCCIFILVLHTFCTHAPIPPGHTYCTHNGCFMYA